MKNDIAEVKNTMEEIMNMLEKAEDWISELENMVEKNHSIRAAKRKKKQLQNLRTI